MTEAKRHPRRDRGHICDMYVRPPHSGARPADSATEEGAEWGGCTTDSLQQLPYLTAQLLGTQPRDAFDATGAPPHPSAQRLAQATLQQLPT